MVAMQDVDPKVPYLQQMEEDVEPVVVINTFIVPEGKMEHFMEGWTAITEFMKTQPGYISTQLHRGVGNDNVLVNMAVWESSKQLREAFHSKAFQDVHHSQPEGLIARPLLVQKVAVEGICLG